MLDKLGLTGAVSGLAPLTTTGCRSASRVVTVKLGPMITGLAKRHLAAAAIVQAQPGEILVFDHRGRTDVSGWGGLLSRGAIAKGIAGVIIDGACRDVDESRELGLPVFGRGTVPVTARGRIAEHDCNCPVMVRNVVVNPGDWAIADGSGVVFIGQDRIDEILLNAERIQAKETVMIAAIKAGTPIDQVLGANYEDMLR